jgi:hypothetical protein
LVIATIIPASTNTTIATCIQIQVGDIGSQSVAAPWIPTARARQARRLRGTADYRVGMSARFCNRAIVVVFVSCALGLAAQAVHSPVATALAQPSPTRLSGINIGGLGYGSTPAEADRSIALARQLHANVVRTELPWAVFEPTAPGHVNPKALAFTDRLMADASAAGIKVIATVLATPCWASSAPAAVISQCSPTNLSKANTWPPSDPSTYAAFVAYLAQRYGSQLAAIEVWNEPDQANEKYFGGTEKAKRYAAVLRSAYPAIKQANGGVTVLAGSLVGSNGVFLRALYAAGIKGYYDALAVHFYTLTLAGLRSFRQVQLANGDSKPLWLDEFGWSSCWPKERIQQEQGCVTPQVQAANVRDVFRSLARTSYVSAEVLYVLGDRVGEDFGVVSTQGTPKPAFAALSGALVSPLGRVSHVVVRLRRRGGRLAASGSGPVGDFMRLEAFAGRTLRYRAVFTLDRFNRYTIRLPRVLGTRGLRVRVYQFWAGPQQAAQARI